ncbi:unnamed protein product [Effrenium voratum]|nr:unnamed protein product [Effrenium voratum]
MSFLQSLQNREKLLRWFEDASFKQELDAFCCAHAPDFVAEAGHGLKHRWHELHQQYQNIFEQRLLHFLQLEGMKEKEFLLLTNRYAKHLSNEEEEQFQAFISAIPSCEDFTQFVKLMKEKTRRFGPGPRESDEAASDSSPTRRVPPGIRSFVAEMGKTESRQRLADLVAQNQHSFQVRFQEHRHEWYALHKQFVRLFEEAADEAMRSVGLGIEALAKFLVHEVPMGVQTESIQDFISLLVAAEDYATFVQMMKANELQFHAPAPPLPEPPPLPPAAPPAAPAAPPAPPVPPAPPPTEPQRESVQERPHPQAFPGEFEETTALREVFKAFLDAPDAPEALEYFDASLTALGLQRPVHYATLRGLLRPRLDRRLGGLLDCIDQKLAEHGVKRPHGRYASPPLCGSRVAVAGAGPVGLRSALELRALGAEVVVLERRRRFGRLNRLKLWEWVKLDLQSWGARQLMPKFGAGAGHLHIGIAQLQLLLLKVSLLLGVDLRFGTRLSQEGPQLLAQPEGQEPYVVPCDVLVEAGGPHSLAWREADVAFDTVGTAKATGLVANFRRNGEELEEFSWARQFNLELFDRVKQSTCADLENIVYLRGEEAHYFVMTPKLQSLVEAGVLPSLGTPLGEADSEALARLAQAIAGFFGLCGCEFAAPPQLFDFSKRRSSSAAMIPLEPVVEEAPVLLALVGDALLEPFWPEGLGITRGFLGCLDSCWQLSELGPGLQAARRGHREALLKCCAARAKTWRLLKQLGAANQTEYLAEEHRQYSVDPASRYKPHLLS